jgi:hypothetical protein
LCRDPKLRWPNLACHYHAVSKVRAVRHRLPHVEVEVVEV